MDNKITQAVKIPLGPIKVIIKFLKEEQLRSFYIDIYCTVRRRVGDPKKSMKITVLGGVTGFEHKLLDASMHETKLLRMVSQWIRGSD